jgi:RNA polymerase sigma factor (sigma-70 family)
LEFREELFEDDGYNTVEDIVSDIDLHMMYDEVVKAIADLDEIYSMTLLLRYEKGMKPDEIAETMGISNKTVYTRLSRGKKLLREALKGAKYGQKD